MINPFSPTAWVEAILKFLISDPAGYFLHRVADTFATSSAPDFGAAWWLARYNATTVVADVVAVLLLVLATAYSALRNRSVTWHGPLVSAAVVGFAIPVAPYALGGLVAMVDWACQVVAGDARSELDQFVKVIGDTLAAPPHSAAGAVATGAVLSMGSSLVLAGGVICWVFELLRRILLDVSGVFLPLALVGLIFRPTAVWARRLIEVVFAAVISQFLLVTVAMVGVAAVVHGSTADSLSTLALGGLVLGAAGLVPFLAVSAAPIVDARIISGHMDHQAVARNVPGASTGGMVMRQTLAGAGTAKPVRTPRPAPPRPPEPVRTGGRA